MVLVPLFLGFSACTSSKPSLPIGGTTGGAKAALTSSFVTSSDQIKNNSVLFPKTVADVRGDRIVGCVFGPDVDTELHPGKCSLYAATNLGEVLKMSGSTVDADETSRCRSSALATVDETFQESAECHPFLGYLVYDTSTNALKFSDRGEKDFAPQAIDTYSSSPPIRSARTAIAAKTTTYTSSSMGPEPVTPCGYKNQFSSMAQCLKAQGDCMSTGWIYVTGCNYYCDGAPPGVLSSAYNQCPKPSSATGLTAQPEGFNYGILSTGGQFTYNLGSGIISLPANAGSALVDTVKDVGKNIGTCTMGGASSWWEYGVACTVTAVSGTVAVLVGVTVLAPTSVVATTLGVVGTGLAALGTAADAGKTLYIALNPNQSISEQIERMEKQNGHNFVGLAGNLLALGAGRLGNRAPAMVDTAVDLVTETSSVRRAVLTGDEAADLSAITEQVLALRPKDSSAVTLAGERQVINYTYQQINQIKEVADAKAAGNFDLYNTLYYEKFAELNKTKLIFAGVNTATEDSARFKAIASDLDSWKPEFHQTVSLAYDKLTQVAKNHGAVSAEDVAREAKHLASNTELVKQIVTAPKSEGGLGIKWEEGLQDEALKHIGLIVQNTVKQETPLYRLIGLPADTPPGVFESAEKLAEYTKLRPEFKNPGMYSCTTNREATLDFMSNFPAGTKFIILEYPASSGTQAFPVVGSGPLAETANACQGIAGNKGFCRNEVVIVRPEPAIPDINKSLNYLIDPDKGIFPIMKVK